MIRFIEELSLNAWPALQTCVYDGWVLRFADGYTKRSNSIIPLYESYIPLEEKIGYCEEMYAAWGLPATFKLTAESKPMGLDDILERKGYQKMGETSVRLLALSQFTTCFPKDVIIEEKISERWINGFFQCSGLVDPKLQNAARHVLANIRAEIVCVAKFVQDQIVGCGFGVMERGYTGIFDIIVDKNHRRRGYGEDIMNGILSGAKHKGMQTSYLQVVVGNTPAENLYSKLGYKEVYRYWYRKNDGFKVK
jgi:GNAT superfamily N-acetyltransferase